MEREVRVECREGSRGIGWRESRGGRGSRGKKVRRGSREGRSRRMWK